MFRGRVPEHLVCSRERRHTQMDLTAMEYSHYLSDESRFIHKHNDGRKNVYWKEFERIHIQCMGDVRTSDHHGVVVRGAKKHDWLFINW